MDSLKALGGGAGDRIMFVNNPTCSYVHLAEGVDGPAWLCNVSNMAIGCWLCYGVQDVIRLNCTILSKQHTCGKNHQVSTADCDWFGPD